MTKVVWNLVSPYINNIEDIGNHTKPQLRQIDLEELRKHIQVLDDLMTGKWLDYSTYRGLATNLVLIKGGQKRYEESLQAMVELYKDTVEFQQALHDNPNFLYRLQVLPTVINRYSKHYGYTPIDLEYFSPHVEDYIHVNILTPLRQVLRVEAYQGKPVDDVRQEVPRHGTLIAINLALYLSNFYIRHLITLLELAVTYWSRRYLIILS